MGIQVTREQQQLVEEEVAWEGEEEEEDTKKKVTRGGCHGSSSPLQVLKNTIYVKCQKSIFYLIDNNKLAANESRGYT